MSELVSRETLQAIEAKHYTEALVANMVEVRTLEIALAQVPFAPGIEVEIEVRDA